MSRSPQPGRQTKPPTEGHSPVSVLSYDDVDVMFVINAVMLVIDDVCNELLAALLLNAAASMLNTVIICCSLLS